MTIKEIISKLESKVPNARKFDGATKAKIDFANAMLKNNNLANISNEYQEFLMETDGMILPPYEFYGTEVINRPEYNYKFPNLIEANIDLVKDKNPLIENRVIIGNVFFDIIIFDEIDKKFKILNRVNFEIIETFENFKQLLEYVIKTV